MPDPGPEPTPKPRHRRPPAYGEDGRDTTIARLAGDKRHVQHLLKAERELTARLTRDLEASKATIAELKPQADGSKVQELQAELSHLKHRGRFDAVAKELGANPGALDDLYALSGYKPDGDPDDGKIKAAIEAQKAPRAYLFGEPTAAGEKAPEKLPAGPGSDRGGSTTTPPGRFSDDQLNDPAFVMMNWDANVQQAKDGLARGMTR